MKPDLRAILNEIGYSRAIQHNRSLFFIGWEPNDRGSQLFRDKAEAFEDLKSLRRFSEALGTMSPNLLKLLNDHSKNSEDWEQGRDPLIDLAFAAGDLADMAEKENHQTWSGRGASRRPAGEDIALHMAEIFVLGRGKMPGSGAKSGGEPSGVFPQAVHDVFRCIGIPDNFRRPCQKAVAWLKADDHREFKRLMQLREAKGRRISLITGTENK